MTPISNELLSRALQAHGGLQARRRPRKRRAGRLKRAGTRASLPDWSPGTQVVDLTARVVRQRLDSRLSRLQSRLQGGFSVLSQCRTKLLFRRKTH